MSNSQYGYVDAKNYTQNPDGTFKYKITIDKNNTLVDNVAIAFLNVNNIKSPNIPDQILTMTSDNKYIFIDNLISMFYFYQILYASINYNITIPTATNFNLIQGEFPDPADSTLASLSGEPRKMYKLYLLGQNPPDSLLKIDSNKKTWSDIGYIFKSQYDTYKQIPEGEGVPSDVCFTNTLPNPVDSDCKKSHYDCRSCPGRSATITPGLNGLLTMLEGSTTTIIIIVVIVLCCCCSSVGSAFLAMQKRSK